MNKLSKRVDKLEEERFPDADAMRREEELRQAIEKARQRVLDAYPGYEFPDFEGEPPLPSGALGLCARLERSREWARKRILAA